MESGDNSLDKIQYWTEKFKSSMDEQISLQIEATPNSDPTQLKELYLLNKLATLTVAMEQLGKRVTALEGRNP